MRLQNPPPVLDGAYSEECKSFVAACLVKNPAQRPSAAALLSHPFLASVDGIPDGWATFVRSVVGANVNTYGFRPDVSNALYR